MKPTVNEKRTRRTAVHTVLAIVLSLAWILTAGGDLAVWASPAGGDGEPPVASLSCGAEAVQAVAFSPDGHTLAVGMGRTMANFCREPLDVQVWDVGSRRQRHVLRQQNWDALINPGAILYPETMAVFAAMAFLPDGRLATCTDKPLEVHAHDPRAPNGEYSEVRIWDVMGGTLNQTVTYAGALGALAAPGGRTLLGLSGGLVRWDVRTKATTLEAIRADDWRRWGTPDVTPEAASQDTGSLLCTRDGRTAAWRLDLKYTPPEASDLMNSEWPSHGEQEFAVLLLWDVPSGRVQRSLATGDPMAFSPDGKTLATFPDPSSATDRNRVELWNPASGRLMRSMTGLTSPTCGVFTPDGRALIVGHGDGSVTLCPLAEGASRRLLRAAQPPQPEFSGRTTGVDSVAVSPDGHLLAAGCGDGTVQIWRL
jgi:WD40 repeat protein